MKLYNVYDTTFEQDEDFPETFSILEKGSLSVLMLSFDLFPQEINTIESLGVGEAFAVDDLRFERIE